MHIILYAFKNIYLETYRKSAISYCVVPYLCIHSMLTGVQRAPYGNVNADHRMYKRQWTKASMQSDECVFVVRRIARMSPLMPAVMLFAV